MAKQQEIFFSWEAHEEAEKKRTNDWYWGLGLLAIFGSAGAFLVENFLFGVFILLSAIVLFLFARKDREAKVFQVTSKGIQRDDTLYRYQTIEAFWMDTEDDDNHSLIIHTSRFFDPVIAIPLADDIDTDRLHGFLKTMLHEEYIQEPRFHKILDKIGL